MMGSPSEAYYTDIQIIMDFMKLSFVIDKSDVHQPYKKEALELQHQLLDLLPVAQSNHMSEIYKRLRRVYDINYDTLERQTNNNKAFNLILFYDSESPHYDRIASTWDRFKRMNRSNSIYGIFGYDMCDIIYSEKKNIPFTKKQLKKMELFKRLAIHDFPTLACVDMKTGRGRLMRSDITLDGIDLFVAECTANRSF